MPSDHSVPGPAVDGCDAQRVSQGLGVILEVVEPAGLAQRRPAAAASSIMAVPPLDSAGPALYGRRWEHEDVRSIANHSAQEFGAQLPCRPQYPRIRTGEKRTAYGVRVVYREQEARER